MRFFGRPENTKINKCKKGNKCVQYTYYLSKKPIYKKLHGRIKMVRGLGLSF